MAVDKFKQRIKYYMIGVGIGLVATYFFFGSRGCEWLPGNRVKNMIAEKEIFIGDSVKYLMDCQGLNENEIYGLLDDNGDVEFSESKTDGFPKEYKIAGEKDQREMWIRYALFDTTAEVIDFFYDNSEECITEISNRNKTTVPLPLSNVLSIIQSKKFRIRTEAQCKMECYNLSEDAVLNFHNSPKIYVESSKPRLMNPFYVLRGVIDEGEFSFKYVIGESRTRISDIIKHHTKEECDCDVTVEKTETDSTAVEPDSSAVSIED